MTAESDICEKCSYGTQFLDLILALGHPNAIKIITDRYEHGAGVALANNCPQFCKMNLGKYNTDSVNQYFRQLTGIQPLGIQPKA